MKMKEVGEVFFADAHVDTLLRLAAGSAANDAASHVTPQKLKAAGVRLQVMALFAGTEKEGGKPYDRCKELIRALAVFIKGSEGSARQITELPKGPLEVWPSETALLLSIENCYCFEGSIEKLNEFYREGVRLASLTWNGENELASGCTSGDAGLKPFGREAVRRMNELGVAVDLSHINETGFWEVMELSQAAPLCTHSCCKSLCDVPRNLSDDQIRALIKRGGHIGVNYYPKFLRESGVATSRDIADHIDHIAQLGGAENIGLGSDYDGIGQTPADMPNAQCHPVLANELMRRGYNGQTLSDILGNNLVRYLRTVKAAAAEV